MEIIRKKICFDKLLSHRNGIVPYVPKDCDYVGTEYVKTIFSKSNYGSFPCDVALINSKLVSDTETGLSYRENREISRLRYLDVISWYNTCNEIVKNGIVLKKIPYNKANTDPCNKQTQNTDIQAYDLIGWTEDEEVSMYNCKMVDGDFLNFDSNGVFVICEDVINKYSDLSLRYGPEFDASEMSDEDNSFISKYNMFVGENYDGILFTDENIFIVNGYDDYFKLERNWNSWWSKNWGYCSFNPSHVEVEDHDNFPVVRSTDNSFSYTDWEQYVFEYAYHKPISLKFIYDVEKYFLGRVKVPESYSGKKIEGVKVPNYVFYFNYMDYLEWFNTNEEYLDSNDVVRTEWEKRGGYAFKNFLSSIFPVFLDDNDEPLEGSVAYFRFVSPNIEIQISFCDEFNNETSYIPYEYSIVDNNVTNGTIEYVKGEEGLACSALTPSFMTFDKSVYTESKLNTLISNDVYYINNDIYGVFDNFDSGGCLFKCKFFTGKSEGDISKYTSGYVKYYAKQSDDTWNEIKTVIIPEKYIETTKPDVLPKTHSNAYQVVGIKSGSVITTTSVIQTSEGSPYYVDEDKLKIVSAITTYNKTSKISYTWCECEKVSNTTGIGCGDGENIEFNGSNKYRNILTLSCAPSVSENISNGSTYYYMAKYDNGYTDIGGGQEINSKTNKIKSFRVPFVVGEQKNMETYSGDFSNVAKYDMVLKQSFDDSGVTFDYVIGATLGGDVNKTGIHYMDRYQYGGNVFVKTVIDGLYEADILYEKINFENNMKLVYSEDLNANRMCNVAEITGMEVGTQWTSESSVFAYLFTEDTFDNLMEYPKISVDISYNRGNAAAWEKHFKLSECNTFDDLINYGNNYFNL